MARLLLVLLACVITAGPGFAAVRLESRDSVVIGPNQRVTEDVTVAGNSVDIRPSVDGDVTAAGQSVNITGSVTDSVLAVGNTVNVTGSVGNDVRLAGNTVTLSGPVADNAYMAGSTVTLADGGNVRGDLLAAGSRVDLRGIVAGNARLAGAEVVIGGTVNGDVYTRANRLRVLDSARINGNLFYESENRADIAEGATIGGRTVRSIPAREQRRPVFWPMFLWWLMWLLAAIIFSIVVYLLFPARVHAAADMAIARLGASIGVGFIALIVVPVAAVLLMITVIGIPLAIVLMMVYFLLLYAAKAFVGLAIGQWILGRTGRQSVSPIWAIVLGVVVLEVVSLIPFVGWLFALLALLAGLGGFLLSWWRDRSVRETPAAI